MELGAKIKAARLEAGLSQRQLCGEMITRNMLSQIENGSARPSMDTLRFLAERLGKPVSYFLEETAITSPNQAVMEAVRNSFRESEYGKVLEALKTYREPDGVFDQEYALLRALCLMGLAKIALEDDRLPYAVELLVQAGKAGAKSDYYSPALERERLLLLAQAAPGSVRTIVAALTQDDRELLLRAEAALKHGNYGRCCGYLDAAENRDAPRWHLLRGEADFGQQDYNSAAKHFSLAEETFPVYVIPRLEVCYRELGDFKRAYEYACKQK